MTDAFEDLLARASSDPSDAMARAERILNDNPSEVERARALRVTGLASANLGDLKRSRADLESALAAATAAGDQTVLGETQMTLAGVLASSGEQERSLDAIDAAFNLLDGTKRAMAQAQRGGIHYRLGNFALARMDLDAAIASLDAAGELMWWGHAVTNRGLLNAYEGDIAAARADLVAAKSGYTRLAHTTSMAFADQNLGWLALRSGDFPAALNFLDEAETAFAELGMSLGQLWCNRAETLLAAHMATDAQQIAVKAARELRRNGLQAGYADALLQAAQAALLAGDSAMAIQTARTARDLMDEQGRAGWMAFADYLVIRARALDGDLAGDDLPAIRDAVAALDKSGLRPEAVHARLLAAGIATAVGDFAACREHLEEASAARYDGPVELRVQGWVAIARLRLHAGDTRGAAAAARAGLRILDDYQATLGGTAARLHLSAHGGELAKIGLRLARESGSARRLFEWMELTRAGALRSQPGPSTRDEMLSSHLMMFRRADEELRRATLNGETTHMLEARRLDLQERVRSLAVLAKASSARRSPVPAVGDILARLGDASLVEFGEAGDGTLLAVRLERGRARQFDLGPLANIRHELDALSVALRRIASGSGSEASRAVALDIVAAASRSLDEMLVEPLRLAGGATAIIPVGQLYAVPWSLLPSLERVPVVVAPSAALWAQLASEADTSATDVSVIAGPRLAHSVEEVSRISSVYPRALELVEPTAEAAARAIDGAAVAHLACHGTFRADNPLFSSLEMKDGALTVYDLEALQVAPRIMVLSACDAGANTSTGGHEVMGLATALLGQGTTAVVANVGLVPDQRATIDLMVDLHQSLRSGQSVARALAAAFPDLDYSNPDAIAARAFVTFGG